MVWGCSSVGRAPRSQRGGQRFDPAQLHHFILSQPMVFPGRTVFLFLRHSTEGVWLGMPGASTLGATVENTLGSGIHVSFSHRTKTDGTFDSICLTCLTTISTQNTEGALQREEEDHVCRFAFPSRRSGKLPAELKQGRRHSDAEWERFSAEK